MVRLPGKGIPAIVLIFCDIASAQNLAKGKTTTQSSIYSGFGPQWAVDGMKRDNSRTKIPNQMHGGRS
jgi:hypothetical protein